jgi:hypothetical protein
MSAEQLIDFLVLREKLALADGRYSLNISEVCDH